MKRKINKLMMIGLSVAMATPVVSALPSAPESVDVTVQKFQFVDVLVDDNFQTDGFSKTGADLDAVLNSGTAEKYDVEKYGKVGFTLYKLNKDTVEAKGQELIAAGTSDSQLTNALALAASEDLEGFGAEKEGDEVFVDADSAQAVFPAVPANSNDYYLIVETTSASTVIGAAVPMLIQLPITNQEGDGYLDEVYLQAKNEIESIDVPLVKWVETLTGPEAAKLAGATFDLYKGVPGSGELLQSGLKTDADGTITIKDVALGSYYFVEVGTVDLVDDTTLEATEVGLAEQGVGTYLASRWARNDDDNKLTFVVNEEEGLVYESELFANFKNYERPTIDKEVTNAADEEQSYSVNEIIKYSVTIPNPKNLEDYTVFEYTDIPVENLDINIESIAIEGLEKGTDYTVTEVDGGAYTLNFVVDNGITDAVKAMDEYVVTYDAEITSSTVTTLDNTVILKYATNAEIRYDQDAETVATYGITFKKIDAGRFGLITGDGLAGAEFVVRQAGEDGKYLAISEEGVYSWIDSDEGAYVFVSGDGGVFEVTGLKAGSYELVEIKAPVGYELPIGDDAVTAFTIGAESYADVKNKRSDELPMSGAEKLTASLIGGSIVIGAAFLVVAIKRKKESEADA